MCSQTCYNIFHSFVSSGNSITFFPFACSFTSPKIFNIFIFITLHPVVVLNGGDVVVSSLVKINSSQTFASNPILDDNGTSSPACLIKGLGVLSVRHHPLPFTSPAVLSLHLALPFVFAFQPLYLFPPSSRYK